MKIMMRLFVLVLVSAGLIFVSSCEKQELQDTGKGQISFSVTADEDGNLLKSAEEDTTVNTWYGAIVTVLDENEEPVMEDELIPMYKWGHGFVTEKVEIKTGKYLLTKFVIVNPAGEVIFAAPMKGSDMAYLVNRPLPMNFEIAPEETTTVRPEVLVVDETPPEQFGYVVFHPEIVRILTFYIAVCADDPMIFSPTCYTSAKLTVINTDNSWHHSFKLEPIVNKVLIRGGSPSYHLIVRKEGYPEKSIWVDAKKLASTTPERPLIIKLGEGPVQTVRIKPDAEKGKDAMIKDIQPKENFGRHPYFEATYASDGMLTVMARKYSLIDFNPRRHLPKSARVVRATLLLWYELPVPWEVDSVSAARSDYKVGTVLKRIVESWEEHEVCWATQPKTTDQNAVYIPPFTKNANMIKVDVTQLVLDRFKEGGYGMFFSLAELSPADIYFPGMRFASSDHKDRRMHPEMVIDYVLPR